MENFADILKQFSIGQRVFVLLVLLVFSSGTYLAGQYFKQDSCQAVIDENLELQKDFLTISKMIRDTQMQNIASKSMERFKPVLIEETNLLDSILIISNKHTKQ